jgi:hypothetical protein
MTVDDNRRAYVKSAAHGATVHLSEALVLLRSATLVTGEHVFDQVVYDLTLLEQQVNDIAKRQG